MAAEAPDDKRTDPDRAIATAIAIAVVGKVVTFNTSQIYIFYWSDLYNGLDDEVVRNTVVIQKTNLTMKQYYYLLKSF